MKVSFAISADGCSVAYEVIGKGSAIMLLHGGNHTRRDWHDVGYVERLKDDFTVIAVDIRGCGESDKPTDPVYYSTDRMCQDLLAVADSCGVERFIIWGFSYGGNIGRYLASQSDHVAKMIIMGIPFGLGASGDFRQSIEAFRAHWTPIVQARLEGTLDVSVLSEEEREYLRKANVPLDLARFGAMLEWAAIEPADLKCPTLWLMGSENAGAIASVGEYEGKLEGTKVQVQIVEGIDHKQEFTEIERVLSAMLAFTQS